MGYFLLTLLMLVGIFLMFVILIQRGRGGGLAGAFGGLGGQSAFGTKAGDVFTVITIVTAVIWVLLACLAGWYLRTDQQRHSGRSGDESISVAPESGAEDEGDLDKSPVGTTEAEKKPAEKPSTEGTSVPGEGDASGTKEAPAGAGPEAGEKPAEESKADGEKKPAGEE